MQSAANVARAATAPPGGAIPFTALEPGAPACLHTHNRRARVPPFSLGRFLPRLITRSPVSNPPPYSTQRDLATLLPTAWVYWQAVEEPGSTWGLVQATFPAESKAEIEKVRPTDGDNLELLNDADAAASDARAAAAAEVAAAAPRAPVKIIFTPQYHVVKLLARAVPRGARVFAVPELKQRGAGAWLGGGRVTYALVNPSKARGPRALTLDARPLLVAAGGKAAAARVTTLDAAALDRAAAEAGGDVGASSREVVKDLTIGEGGSVDVAVAPGHVAVIEITAV